MTDKIILEALKLKGFQNPESLVRIVSLTPNPQATLETLLGVFTPTNAEDFGLEWKGKYNSDSFFIWVDSIDDLANTVTYKKYEHNTQTVYYLNREDRELGVFVTEQPKDYYNAGYQKTTGYKFSTETCTMQEFSNKYVKNAKDWADWANDANTYVNPLLLKPVATEDTEF